MAQAEIQAMCALTLSHNEGLSPRTLAGPARSELESEGLAERLQSTRSHVLAGARFEAGDGHSAHAATRGQLGLSDAFVPTRATQAIAEARVSHAIH